MTPPYTVRRSTRARRARLTVTPEGAAVVVLPARAPERLAAELVARHAGWLDRHVRRARSATEQLAGRPSLEDGRMLVISGLPHRVAIVPDPAGRVRSRVGRVIVDVDGTSVAELRVLVGGRDARSPSELIEGWLRDEATRVITERVSAHAPQVGVTPSRVGVRGARQRWGSASRRGSLSFNWRLILAPPDVLEYVVVHELVHLVVPGHSPRFWTLVAQHAPHADRARRWLRENHRELLAALD